MKTLILTAAAVMMASTANAAVTTFTSQPAFALALGTSTTETFDGPGLNAPGLSVVSAAGSIGGGRFNDRLVRGGASTTFSFAGGAKGAGAFFDETPGGFGQGIAFTLTLTAGGAPVSVTQIDGFSGGFYGFISTDKFDSVLLSAGTSSGIAETYNLDNLQFGGAVPEPATWALMIGGFGMVGAAMRRRSTAVTA